MIYTDYNRLTIIKLEDAVDVISFEVLAGVISDRLSNMIYCELKGKLYGIISMGDIIRADKNGVDFVVINKKYTWVLPDEYIRARNIFREKANINALPVVNNEHKLLGDFTRWEDYLAEYMCMGRKQFFKYYNRVILVRPSSLFNEKQRMFRIFYSNLLSMDISVKVIKPNEILNYIDTVDMVLFVDEDELRATDTWLVHIMHKNFTREKLTTYKKFVKECCYEFAGEYLRDIKKKGVYVLNLVYNWSEYHRILENNIYDNKMPVTKYQPFFDDLYSEEYAESIIHLPFSIETESHLGKLKDCRGEYCNIIGGERYTVGQPEDYRKTVYFVGPCFIYGHFVEDKNTIESLFQQLVNDTWKGIRVVNCGSIYSGRMDLEIARINELPLRKGDIVILFIDNRRFLNIPELNIVDILEKYNANPAWMLGVILHCNHKVNALYAEAVYHSLAPVIEECIKGQGEEIGQDIDFVKTTYIDRYFTDFNPLSYEKIGSIVMNCNPFTYGHRYLIEQALERVDFLIIFVVEEDESLFSFDERFAMVCSGTKDLDNVLIVPSGPFILSKVTFPEYFIKEADEDIVKNVENDITFFAERIAPHLNISYRFVGEEPEDMVTNEYNLAMKKILPKNGIRLIEIPRKECYGRYISASSVRKCLENNDINSLNDLVPESTKRILFMKNC